MQTGLLPLKGKKGSYCNVLPYVSFIVSVQLISRGQDMVPDKLLNTTGTGGRKHN